MVHDIDPTAVKRFPYFQEFTDADARVVAGLLKPLRCSPGQVLFRQGDHGDAVYLLVAGRIEIRISTQGPHDYVCTTLEDGAIFGEIGPILQEPRTASAVALTSTDLWQLPYSSLRAAWDRGEAWSIKFLVAAVHVLARRLIAMNGEVIALAANLHQGPGEARDSREAEIELACRRQFEEELLGLVRRSLA
jgi:CRP-like cAMP-binding protein